MPSKPSYPLTAAQYGIWLGQQLNPHTSAYWAAESIYLTGELDFSAFEQALTQAIQATQILQMVYADDGEKVWQYQLAHVPIRLSMLDFRVHSAPELAAQHYLKKELQQTAWAAESAIFANSLFILADQEYMWCLSVHHIALDGFGFALFIQKVADAYAAITQGLAVVFSAEVALSEVLAEEKRYQTSRAEVDRIFWLDRLQNAPQAITLAPPRAFCDMAIKESILLPLAILEEWKHAAAECGVDWTSWLLAVIALWTQQQTGIDGFRLGLPVMGRLGSVALNKPCMMMNILPFVVHLHDGETLQCLCQNIAAEMRRIRPHQRYRYEQLKQDLQLVGTQRLFGTVVNIMPFERPIHFGNLSASFQSIATGPVEDLAISIVPLAEGVHFSMDANPAAYSVSQLAEKHASLLQLLAQVAQMKACSIVTLQRVAKNDFIKDGSLSILQGEALLRTPSCVLDLFLEQVKTRPQHPALEQNGEMCTYADLLNKVQFLASQLQPHGVKTGSRVVLLLPRQMQTISAILATLWLGAAYIPLDPDSAMTRIQMVLNDVRPHLVVTLRQYQHLLSSALPVLYLNELEGLSPHLCLAPVAVAAQDLAYFIYTSGSTGAPNGVMISRQALAYFVASASQRYAIHAEDRILQFAPLHFDASIEEIFLTLCVGATLVLRNDAMLESMPHFLQTLKDWRISVLDLPTAFWHELTFSLGNMGQGLAESVRLVIIGGEAALAERVTRWRTQVSSRVKLFNTYGPTEATVICSSAVLSGDEMSLVQDVIPIGRPLAGITLVVINSALRPCLQGEIGELCVISPSLAQGYWERETVNAARFITLEGFADKAYRTGDCVQLGQDQQLYFMGRLDDEFKLSGHRIDPAEVETALLGFVAIREAAVLGFTLADGMKIVVAFIVLERDDSVFNQQALRAYLLERLAAPAIPSRYLFMRALPRNANGKIDRKFLRQHPDLIQQNSMPCIMTEMEKQVMTVWQEVLGLANMRVEDDFFASGGKSLQAIQVANRLGVRLQREVAVSILFRYRTIAELAQALSSPARHAPPLSTPNPLAPCLILQRGMGTPLFCVHPAEGLAWCYLGLAQALPELSIIGLQATGLSGVSSVDFASMIAEYKQQIYAQQAEGAYRLLGWSSGGGIAHALAVALQQDGKTVDFLAMMDAYPADIWQDKPVATRRDALVNLLDVMGGSEYDANGNLLNEAELSALLSRPGSVLAEHNLSHLTEVSLQNMHLYRQAKHAVFKGNVLFFRAKRRSINAPESSSWQPYVYGHIQVVDIDSSHTEMSLPAPLAAIGQVLAQQLIGEKNEQHA